jgi:hypothetical protein
LARLFVFGEAIEATFLRGSGAEEFMGVARITSGSR